MASFLAANSVNQKAMMELLGHRDPKMVLRYTHLSMNYMRQAVEGLPKLDAAVLEAESPRISPQEEKARVVGFRKSLKP